MWTYGGLTMGYTPPWWDPRLQVFPNRIPGIKERRDLELREEMLKYVSGEYEWSDVYIAHHDARDDAAMQYGFTEVQQAQANTRAFDVADHYYCLTHNWANEPSFMALWYALGQHSDRLWRLHEDHTFARVHFPQQGDIQGMA